MKLSPSLQHSHQVIQSSFVNYSPLRHIAALLRSAINSHFVTLLRTYNREFEIDLSKIRQVPQNGHTCKITALSSLDFYHSCFKKIAHIPLRKSDLKAINSETSFRQLSKKHHSLQGEVLEDKRLINIAAEAGYSTSVKKPKNVHEFKSFVAHNISKGFPVLACFSVNHGQDPHAKMDFPTDIYDNSEHACLITKINRRNNTIDIVHWQTVYKNVSIDSFYKSMNALPETRTPETYVKINGSSNRKYELVGYHDVNLQELAYDENSTRTTEVPEKNTGFKNRLFVMKPDQDHPRWHHPRSKIIFK